MKVKARVSFAGRFASGRFAGRGFSYSPGEVFDLPAGVDWLQAGLVTKVIEKRTKRTASKKAKAK